MQSLQRRLAICLGNNGEVVPEFPDLIIATGGRAEDLEIYVNPNSRVEWMVY